MPRQLITAALTALLVSSKRGMSTCSRLPVLPTNPYVTIMNVITIFALPMGGVCCRDISYKIREGYVWIWTGLSVASTPARFCVTHLGFAGLPERNSHIVGGLLDLSMHEGLSVHVYSCRMHACSTHQLSHTADSRVAGGSGVLVVVSTGLPKPLLELAATVRLQFGQTCNHLSRQHSGEDTCAGV